MNQTVPGDPSTSDAVPVDFSLAAAPVDLQKSVDGAIWIAVRKIKNTDLTKLGGALLSIGKDPHTTSDDWWVYDYFTETREIDRARYAPVRILRGELTLAGFATAESFEADRIDAVTPAADAFADVSVTCCPTTGARSLSNASRYCSTLRRVPSGFCCGKPESEVGANTFALRST